MDGGALLYKSCDTADRNAAREVLSMSIGSRSWALVVL
jgi:hypothetical protein